MDRANDQKNTVALSAIFINPKTKTNKTGDQKMATCSKCGTENAQGMKFCGECGTPLPQTKKCPQCGTEWSSSTKFCGECGYNFAGTKGSDANNSAEPKVDLQRTLKRYMAARDFPNVPHISKEEFSVIERAAKNNEDGRALLVMGDCYFMGDVYFHRDGNGVVSQDLDQAKYWYELAVSEWGVSEAKEMCINYGMVLRKLELIHAMLADRPRSDLSDLFWEEDYDRLFSPIKITPALVYFLMSLSAQGNNLAKMGLARLLFEGGGEIVTDLGFSYGKIGRDPVDLIRDAAEQGLPVAAYFLGTSSMEWYFKLPEDERRDWLTRAAEQGVEIAKKELEN